MIALRVGGSFPALWTALIGLPIDGFPEDVWVKGPHYAGALDHPAVAHVLAHPVLVAAERAPAVRAAVATDSAAAAIGLHPHGPAQHLTCTRRCSKPRLQFSALALHPFD